MQRKINTKMFRKNRMIKLFPLSVILFMIFVFSIQCVHNKKTSSNQQQKNPNFEIFNKIITENFFRSSAKNKVPFKLITNNIDGAERIYSIELDFKKSDPYEHYICSIGVAKAGTYIKAKEYEKSYAYHKGILLKKHPADWQKFLQIEFPDIGKRAIKDRGTFGPGGAMYAVMFTSSDCRFDIKASISNLLPEDVDDPDFNLIEMLKKISDMYDRKTIH